MTDSINTQRREEFTDGPLDQFFTQEQPTTGGLQASANPLNGGGPGVVPQITGPDQQGTDIIRPTGTRSFVDNTATGQAEPSVVMTSIAAESTNVPNVASSNSGGGGGGGSNLSSGAVAGVAIAW